ncbi:MAG TPA: molybdenum cofactor synthesis domain-containing protein [Gammaproteobacteria bacterium]|nr:molybdenum cofactor synthesis domain-containing protein [Gammaproteobacteria bacterium]
MAPDEQPASPHIAVLTVSDSRTTDTDGSGRFLAGAAAEAGHIVVERALLRDDKYAIRAKVAEWIADELVEVVLPTGGTGITGRDVTPEAVAPLLDKEIAGSAIARRAFGGIANGTLVFALPGSTSACRTGWSKILREQLDPGHEPCNLASLLPRLRER